MWIANTKALGGFRSALVEPAADGGAKVVAERPEAVVASSADLWVVRFRKARGVECEGCEACDPDAPTCGKEKRADLDEPVFESLRTGRVVAPWQKEFARTGSCEAGVAFDTASVTLTGAVGPVIFASVSTMSWHCGAAHPDPDENSEAFDFDKGRAVTLAFPADASRGLAKAAATALTRTDDCPIEVEDPSTLTEAWVTAAYGADGVLTARYMFTTPASYTCATGPGHYKSGSEQASTTLPRELVPYARLPAYVASYLAARKAMTAMLIAPSRVAAAEAEMERR